MEINHLGIKLPFFEYALNGFLNWYGEVNQKLGNDKEWNDISVLKSMKLLFFLTAESTVVSKELKLSKDIFSDFHALPYGPVESSLYNHIVKNNGNLEFFTINSLGLFPKEEAQVSDLEIRVRLLDSIAAKELDDALESLKDKNELLIILPAFDLVDISHQWFSWKKNISVARNFGMNSKPIPFDDIVNDSKKYTLSEYL